MKVTNTTVRLISGGGKLKATATVTFDDSLVVEDLRIVDGTKGLWVAMPSRKVNDRGYKDVVYTRSAELRQEIRDAVLKVFEAQPGQTKADAAPALAPAPVPGAEEENEAEMAEAV